MTSKETLRKLKMLRKHCELKNWDGCYIYLELMDGAIENLEVLEIIKGKLMWVENDKIYIGLQNDTYIELTEEDFNYDDRYIILKEWLEDEEL